MDRAIRSRYQRRPLARRRSRVSRVYGIPRTAGCPLKCKMQTNADNVALDRRRSRFMQIRIQSRPLQRLKDPSNIRQRHRIKIDERRSDKNSVISARLTPRMTSLTLPNRIRVSGFGFQVRGCVEISILKCCFRASLSVNRETQETLASNRQSLIVESLKRSAFRDHFSRCG